MKLNDEYTDELLPEQIVEEVRNHRKKRERYIELRELYKGNHPIYTMEIKYGRDSNIREAVNFIGTTIDSKVGYVSGAPIVITADKSEEVQNVVDAILMGNHFPHLMTGLVKDVCIVGKGYLLLFQDYDEMTRFKKVPAEEMIVYRGRDGEIYMAIRYFYKEYVENGVSQGRRLYAEVYRRDRTDYYIEDDKGKLCMYMESEHNIYDGVPVIEFLNNEEGTSDVEPIEGLNHVYNVMFCNMADENQEIRNSYLKFKNMGKIDEKDMDTMRKARAISVPESGDVDFLTKDAKTESTERFLEKIEEKIYELAQVPNFNDENFAGNLSGVAIRYKMIPMENNAMIKEKEMTKAINTLLMVLSPVIRLKANESYGIKDYSIQFKRTMPIEVGVEDVFKLANLDLLDKKTLLSLLPFIEDPSSVIEKKKEEELEDYGTYYNTNNHAS